ncbi:uncharacterized protein LOC116125402 [Pistacia vera]|uniref:uncharacterized protein LOC116125402 n=1 Tax=Pistacia vera TaxID=55513 RepID=UPI001263C173|nr:uncharacterized protein LOC116125402 [Pistacia vera]
MTTSTLSLRSIIEKDERFDGTNFIDWYQNLRIVIKSEKKLYIIDEPVMEVLEPKATPKARDTYQKYLDDADIMQCLLLSSMMSDLQEQYQHLDASSIITNLNELFQNRARHKRYEASKTLFRFQISDEAQVGPHVIKMIGYIQRLETFGILMDAELSMDLVLQSLS